MLKKRDSIIASVRSRIARKTHKYGIEIPTSWKHATEINVRNKNCLWQDALAKEMKNLGVAFDVLEAHENVPVGLTKASGHLVWDVMMDFTQKARWVKDGHRTEDPLGTSYAGVVSRDSVRISFTLAAMNGLYFARLIFRMPIFKPQRQRNITRYVDLSLVSIKERRP